MERRVQAAVLLGVAIDAAEAEVMRAWRVAIKAAHPDAGGDAEQFAEATDARDVLLEPMPIEAAEPKPEVAATAARATRPELGPMRFGLLVVTPPLAAAVVVVAYVLSPGLGVAVLAVYVSGVVAHAVYVAAGQPPLWRMLRPWRTYKRGGDGQ